MAIWTTLLKVVSTALNPKKVFVDIVRRTLLRPTIAALKSMGMTNQQLWKELKVSGFGKIGTPQTVDTASYIASLDNVDKVLGVMHNQRVPIDFMTETRLPSARRYRYIANATVRYKGRLSSTSKYISFYTDEWKNLEDYQDEITKILDSEQYELDYQILDLKYEAVLHQRGDTYQ